MNNDSRMELPEEFKDGPWITGQEVMDWLDLSKERLKSWRARGILAYSDGLGGTPLYNKPWILWKLAEGWTWKQPKPKKKK